MTISCSKCKKEYSKRELVQILGGYRHVRGLGILTFKCACGDLIKMNYLEPNRKLGFFLTLDNFN